MTKKIVLNQRQRQLLKRQLRRNEPYTDMAASIGCCVDTLKRILHREDLRRFDGAKYAVSPSNRNNASTWCRPCLACGDDAPRARWQYLCLVCKKKNDSNWSGIDEDYLIE